MSPTSCQTAPPRDRFNEYFVDFTYMTQRGETIAPTSDYCQLDLAFFTPILGSKFTTKILTNQPNFLRQYRKEGELYHRYLPSVKHILTIYLFN